MTGPEHYAEAERLLDAAIGSRTGEELVLLAQVHATLALTAATVNSYQSNADAPPDWAEAIS